jgi:hypothetical protein
LNTPASLPPLPAKENQTIFYYFILELKILEILSEKTKGEIEAFLRDSGFESVSVLQPHYYWETELNFRLGEK